ncbi:type VII secretion system-associated protein [Actinosynnema sp. CA-299493]
MEVDADVENWFLLMDHTWEPQSQDEAPPLEAVVGLWPVHPDGRVGPFRTNPAYFPGDPDSPADPMDALLRQVINGQAQAEQFQLLLRDSLFDIAMNGDDRPLVMLSPDDVQCVVITTSEVHRQRVSSPDWRRIDLADLVNLLADDVDVLFNPGGPASARLFGDFMRRALAMTDDELAEAYERFRKTDVLEVTPWEVPPVSSAKTDDVVDPVGAPHLDGVPVPDGEADVEEQAPPPIV